MSSILSTLTRCAFGKTGLLSILLTAVLTLPSFAQAIDYIMTPADYDKERARVAKHYTAAQKQEFRQQVGAHLDLQTFEELNQRAEDVWNELVRTQGSSQKAVQAMQLKKTPRSVVEVAQELSNFLASSDANFEKIIERSGIPAFQIHPLLVHLLAATIVSKGITVINDTRPGFFESPLAHPYHIRTLLMTAINRNGHQFGIKKVSAFTRQEARTMLLAMSILSLLDTSDFYAIDYRTLHWLRLFIAQDFNSLANNMIGQSQLYFALTGNIPGLTSNESTLNTYNMTQAPKDERVAVAEKVTGYDYETFLRYMDRISAGKER